MPDRRQTTDLTGRRLNQERRKDHAKRAEYDKAIKLANEHIAIYGQYKQGLIDQFQYQQKRRWLIEEMAGINTGSEDAAKKIRVIQEKEESHAGI